MTRTISGHKVVKGRAYGVALVCKSAISFQVGVNPATGVVVEKGHELEGQSVAGKVLIFPTGKGSTAGATQLYELSILGNAPVAILNHRTDPIVAVGAVLGKIPVMDQLEIDPVETINTGDLVEVNADQSLVTVGRSMSTTLETR